MIKERLIDLNIKITELANYFNISRPTMYKYIESFDNDDFEKIPKSIYDLFIFIKENKLIGKINVIDYVINYNTQLAQQQSKINKRNVTNFLKQNEEITLLNEKAEFVVAISKKDTFDKIITFLNKVNSLPKSKLTDEEQEIKNKYEQILKII